ncbi:uncharacterized protein LOC125666774 [Ostrea edulis]|uniref:uncharacterized protein LOC125666774 n=1 Tax=Ostrea edulis TaxID=37623 RepID=UPI0024AE92D4|nr:uncharacterized protein LOC125666774 [Ostrea edulis]
MDTFANVIRGTSLVEILQISTCTFAGIFNGFGLYSAVVEGPSRASLPLRSRWEQWANSFRIAAKQIGFISLSMAASSGGVYYLSPSSPVRSLWLVPVGASLFSLFYTVFVMAPDIKILLENDVITKKGHQWVEKTIGRLRKRNYARVVVIGVAYLVSIYAAVKS